MKGAKDRIRRGRYFIGSPVGEGSVAAHFAALGNELAARGHQVTIISQQGERRTGAEDRNPEWANWPSPRPTRLADAIFLARMIRRSRPDCLIANFAAVNWMCFIGWFFRVPHRVAFYHTLSAQIARDHYDDSKGQRLLTLIRKRWVYKCATRIVGISSAALQDAQRHFGVLPQKCSVWSYSMPDPASRIRLCPAEDREDVIVCAGRLSCSKGQDVLIAALALANGSLNSLRVEFLGSGPMLNYLRQMAKEMGVGDRCRFLGKVSHEEVLQRMSQARFTVVPSRNEAFGLVNIESLSVGTPVIASNVDGIPEIIRDGLDGYLLPPEDTRAFAEKLSCLAHESDLCARFGRNGRQRFLAEYENAAAMTKQADWLERMAGSPRRDGEER